MLRCHGCCCTCCASVFRPRIWCSCAEGRRGGGSTSLPLEQVDAVAAAWLNPGGAAELGGDSSSQVSASSCCAPSWASIQARSGSGWTSTVPHAAGEGTGASIACSLCSCMSQSAWAGDVVANRLANVASASERRGRGKRWGACGAVWRAVGPAGRVEHAGKQGQHTSYIKSRMIINNCTAGRTWNILYS